MSILGSIEETVVLVEEIASAVPGSNAATLMLEAAEGVAAVLHVVDQGIEVKAVVDAVTALLVAQSDAKMKETLGP